MPICVGKRHEDIIGWNGGPDTRNHHAAMDEPHGDNTFMPIPSTLCCRSQLSPHIGGIREPIHIGQAAVLQADTDLRYPAAWRMASF